MTVFRNRAAHQSRHVGARIAGFVDDAQCRSSVGALDRVDEPARVLTARRSERRIDGVDADCPVRIRSHLFEHRQCVAQAAVRAVGDRTECSIVDRNRFGIGDRTHARDHDGDWDASKRIALTA